MLFDRDPTHAFGRIGLDLLDRLSSEALARLPYGVVGLAPDGTTEVYSAREAEYSAIEPEAVLGSHFFTGVGQCMNNFMVAQRFEDEAELDAEIDYVLTFRMRPTPVRLRLLTSAAVTRRYILIQR